ncbi:unnamed protein product [Cuscuta epithymum]|uniref:Protein DETOXIFICATION n=1 Tax=Cuscuta epithymum TaxID=186058 RepID=A0AAV0FM34_9ASTE|nr:unnamed protein product [Cuscuta epithymum]CAH9136493.1 unnamed protein product [Cuscuta epithymum]
MEDQHGKPSSISEPLIDKSGYSKQQGSLNRKEIADEVKKQAWLAGPLICVSLLQYCLQLISVMFVGHLGELALSGASMATSFATVTGFSLLMGMSSALDTLCGQSYGAKQYHMMGIQMQRAMLVLELVCIPLSMIWLSTGPILKAFGQEAAIADAAGRYAQFMTPSLFAYGLLQCLVRFLQTQNIVFPMVLTSGIVTVLHTLTCWVLVFKSGLGFRGAALANAISNWLNVLLLALYVMFSSSCSKTWTGFSKEALNKDILVFLKLAVPSAIMVCLEMWSFELLVLLSGFLPNPELQTSVLSICLNTAATVWTISFGLGAATSTRVSNELGAGHPRTAQVAIGVSVATAASQAILIGSVLLLTRKVLGYAYSNSIPVVEYVSSMMPIVALANFLDGLQTVLSGALRGSGLQKIGAFINLGSFYIVGIPSALLMAFVFHIQGRGLWLGITCALLVQVTSLLIIVVRTNWEQQAKKARERVYCSAIPIEAVS